MNYEIYFLFILHLFSKHEGQNLTLKFNEGAFKFCRFRIGSSPQISINLSLNERRNVNNDIYKGEVWKTKKIFRFLLQNNMFSVQIFFWLGFWRVHHFIYTLWCIVGILWKFHLSTTIGSHAESWICNVTCQNHASKSPKSMKT